MSQRSTHTSQKSSAVVSAYVIANETPSEVSPMERMSWLIELMSRYAREFEQSSDRHESTRLAAAIVAHLRNFANDLPESGRLSDATEHWIDMWDSILSLQMRDNVNRDVQPSLRCLIQRAKAF